VIWWWLACARSPGIEGCAELRDPTEVEDCRLEEALALGDAEAVRVAIASIEPALSRDLLRLRLAVRDPAQARSFCEEVEGDEARRKCEQVLGRPHLSVPPEGG